MAIIKLLQYVALEELTFYNSSCSRTGIYLIFFQINGT